MSDDSKFILVSNKRRRSNRGDIVIDEDPCKYKILKYKRDTRNPNQVKRCKCHENHAVKVLSVYSMMKFKQRADRNNLDPNRVIITGIVCPECNISSAYIVDINNNEYKQKVQDIFNRTDIKDLSDKCIDYLIKPDEFRRGLDISIRKIWKDEIINKSRRGYQIFRLIINKISDMDIIRTSHKVNHNCNFNNCWFKTDKPQWIDDLRLAYAKLNKLDMR
jgi:hypothetical protein